VWKAISTVGFGKTITYGELARRAGCPGSGRAAGAATGRNPISIIVPCHRIVGSNGSLTGYAGGLDRKRALLALESIGRSMEPPDKHSSKCDEHSGQDPNWSVIAPAG
jgi:methylated-DNA-[protein]-cysteine S-methyltransferase